MQVFCGVLPEAVESKIDRCGEGDCWIWTASVSTPGYGQVYLSGRNRIAHRLVYELLVGPIPEGLNLDHLCRNRRCVNPAHLEPVTQRENLMRGVGTIAGQNARKTHCKHGHEFTPENTRRDAKGNRHCRACARQRWQAREVARNA